MNRDKGSKSSSRFDEGFHPKEELVYLHRESQLQARVFIWSPTSLAYYLEICSILHRAPRSSALKISRPTNDSFTSSIGSRREKEFETDIGSERVIASEIWLAEACFASQ